MSTVLSTAPPAGSSSSSVGVGLVSGILGSTLSKAQRAYEFNSPANLSRKQIKKEQLRLRKLKRNHQSPFSSSSSILLPDPDGHNFNFNPIQFECTGDQVSSFIEQLRIKYKPLNQKHLSPINNNNKNNINTNSKKKKKKKEKNKTKSLISGGVILVENESELSLVSGLAREIDNIELDGNNSADENSTLIGPANSKKEKRKRRREAARLRKLQENRKLQDKSNHLVKLNNSNLLSSKTKKMKDNLIIESPSKASNGVANSNSNSTCSGGTGPSTSTSSSSSSSSSIPQLASPKVVLYPREKVTLGWKIKLPPGSGLNNLGNSCYLNATLQALFHTPAFVNWLLRDAEHREKCNRGVHYIQNCTICAMHSTLKELYSTSNGSFRPYLIHNKLRVICKHFTPGRQEDAHEFLRYLLESMERSYLTVINCLRIDNRSKETTPLGQIFGGYLRTEVTCYNCDFISTTFQPLAELQLDIRQVNSLEDALNNHFRKERLDNNDYKCEKCLKISQATKQYSLEIPPQVLCLQLKRFTLYGNKLSKQIHCNRSINLTKYLHKSKSNSYTSDVKYRLVAMITHIGSSPNCGHYTSIAEASNGNFYQFDDSYVHSISLQTALNSDAYVLIYEMEKGSCQTQNPQQGNAPSVAVANTNGIMIKSKLVNSTVPSPLSNGNGTSKLTSNSDLKSTSVPNGDHLHNLFATKSGPTPNHLNKSWSAHSSLKNSISSNSNSSNNKAGGSTSTTSPFVNQNRKFQIVNNNKSPMRVGGNGNGHSALKSAIITDSKSKSPSLSPVKKNIISTNLLSSSKLNISSSTPNLSLNCPSLLSPTKTIPTSTLNQNTCNGLNKNGLPNQLNSSSSLSSIMVKPKLKSKSPEPQPQPEPKVKIPIISNSTSTTTISIHPTTITTNNSAKDHDKSVKDKDNDTRSPFKLKPKKRSRSSSSTSSTDSEPLSKRNKKEHKKHRKRDKDKERNGNGDNRKRNEKDETKSKYRNDDENDKNDKDKLRKCIPIPSKTRSFIRNLFTGSNGNGTSSKKEDKVRLLTNNNNGSELSDQDTDQDQDQEKSKGRSRKDGYNNGNGTDRRRRNSSGDNERDKDKIREKEKKKMNGESHGSHHHNHNGNSSSGSRNTSKELDRKETFDPYKLNHMRRVNSWNHSPSRLSKSIDSSESNHRTNGKTREEIEDDEIDRGKVSKRFRSTSSKSSGADDDRYGSSGGFGNKFQYYEDRKNSLKTKTFQNGYSSNSNGNSNNYHSRDRGYNADSSREREVVRRSHVFNFKKNFNSSSRF